MACPTCGETTRVRDVIQHYEIAREIGRGGMSRVFQAKDSSLDRQVALKVLLDQFNHDDERLKQFEKEAQITASFAHPHVVKVYAIGRDHGDLFIVMELVENGNLDEHIATLGKVPERQALVWAHETAQGLQAAYQNGLIHRDVKPGNILLAQDHSAKLVDFGLALMFQRETDNSEDIWATPFYVSPEKLKGEGEDHRSDIYSLGATLYHLLVGKPSFEVVTGSYEELHAAKTQPAPMKALTTFASRDTCALVDRMMAVNPNDRPPDYEALLTEIENAQSRFTSRNAGERFLAQQRSKRQPSWIKPWLAIAACLVAIGTGAVLLLMEQGTPSQISQLEGSAAETETTPFAKARAQLLSGDWDLASQGFNAVYQAEDTSAGIRQWALYHGALCSLLEGNRSAAKDTFRLLEAFEGPHQELNDFFQSLSESMLEYGPVSRRVAEDMPEGSCNPLALLVYGLKNWELEKLSEAQAHWQRFAAMSPGTEFQWITNYKTLVKDHLADLAILKDLRRPNSLASTDAVQKEIEASVRYRADAKTERAQHILTQRYTRLEKRLRELKNTKASSPASATKQETTAWRTLLQELEPLAETLQFAEGIDLIGERAHLFPSKEGMLGVTDHLHFWTVADQFTKYLIENLAGAEGPIQQRNGNRVQGKVVAITPQQITIQLGSGEVSFPLDTVTPWTLVRFARGDLNDLTDANLFYKRLEQVVAFAHLTDLSKVTRNHANILSRENRTFRERWTRWQASLKTIASSHSK
ncbi:serine/threonine protein kinase [Verrucomicrobiales bacterium]|nr:serine/threonine protein kinase [Verrucomicrobiales bacterium]